MADQDIFGTFIAVIVIQLFFSFVMTGISYTIPTDSLNYIGSFTTTANRMSMNDTGKMIQSSLQQQTNVPVIELGALVFYSGNILLDLILNFAFAIPEMLQLFIAAILLIIPISAKLSALIMTFTYVVSYALFFMGLVQLLVNMRSGRAI